MKTAARQPSRKKIWVTGGSGFLGGTLVTFLRQKHDIVFSFWSHPLRLADAQGDKVNLNSANAIREFIGKHQPDVIVHCAALTDVEYCEQHFDEASRVNVDATRNLAQEAADAGCYLIHISTEAVYGDTPGPHEETELPGPISNYALSKLQAEEVVQKAGGNYLIARTGFEGWSLSESAGKISFFEWLLRKFEQQKPFQVFYDRVFTPLSIYNFVEIINELIEKNITGLFNIEGPDAISYFDFAKKTATVFKHDDSFIVPVRMNEIFEDNKRPHDTSLDTRRIQNLLVTELIGVEKMLHQFREIRDSEQWTHIRAEWVAGMTKVLHT